MYECGGTNVQTMRSNRNFGR